MQASSQASAPSFKLAAQRPGGPDANVQLTTEAWSGQRTVGRYVMSWDAGHVSECAIVLGIKDGGVFELVAERHGKTFEEAWRAFGRPAPPSHAEALLCSCGNAVRVRCDRPDVFYVLCDKCGAGTAPFSTMARALEVWNMLCALPLAAPTTKEGA